MRGHHAGENWCDGGCGRRLSGRSLGWDRGRGRGPMRNEQGSAVDSGCGVLWIAWFGITWCDGSMGSARWYRVGHRPMRVVAGRKRFEWSDNPSSYSFPLHTVRSVLFLLSFFLYRRDSRECASD